MDLSYKSHNAWNKCPTMYHSVTEMCTHVHISVTKCYIMGYNTVALWDLCNRSSFCSIKPLFILLDSVPFEMFGHPQWLQLRPAVFLSICYLPILSLWVLWCWSVWPVIIHLISDTADCAGPYYHCVIVEINRQEACWKMPASWLYLTHWAWDKMAAIFLTTISNAFAWMKVYKFS